MWTLFASGPNFDLHHLQVVDTFLAGSPDFERYPGYIMKRGHFRSKKYNDILYGDPQAELAPMKIYWADDQGKYDSARYTELRSNLPSVHGLVYGYMNPFAAALSSDSVLDIVWCVVTDDIGGGGDSAYLMWFRGGDHLFQQGKTAYADSTFFFDTVQNGIPYILGLSFGDYRGVGREDIIATNVKHQALFYKNDPPFSLSAVVHALKYDTLMASWQNPPNESGFGTNQFSMKAFPKDPDDSSVDFMPISGKNYSGNVQEEIHIYRGGKDFGSKRLFVDSASYVIHSPEYYDGSFQSLTFGSGTYSHPFLFNCGDMTGTGNPVLCVAGDLGGYTGCYFFYVLGKALDDKVDMFFAMDDFPYFTGMDTLVADRDNLQDVIMGLPGYYTQADHQAGKTYVGTMWVIHGSTKIPVKTNGVHTQEPATSNITLLSNPVSDHRLVIEYSFPEQQKLTLILRDLLGRTVRTELVDAQPGTQVHVMPLGDLTVGTYILDISAKNIFERCKVLIIQ
ncbi:MAG TPA: hypothetical protein VEW28_02245 [Candidatus Kapabacteria bacterium]|nr:hypothetical protein [Candidatus Kapabacteria bacterium]